MSTTPASNPYKALFESTATGCLGRANRPFLQTALLTFLASAYIALGGFLAVRRGPGLFPRRQFCRGAFCGDVPRVDDRSHH